MNSNAVWRIIGGLRRTTDTLVIILFVIMMGGVLIQVCGRYVFNYSIAGTEEAARFAQVWMILVGAGVAMRFSRHVAIDILVTKLPIPIARLLNIFITLGCLWFLYLVVAGALPLIQVGMFETSPAMRLPMWTMYVSLVVGSVYFGIEVVLWLVRRWEDPYGKNEATE